MIKIDPIILIPLEVKCDVVPLITKKSTIWIKNKRCSEGGYNRKIIKRLKDPFLLVNFSMKCKNDLRIGTSYQGGSLSGCLNRHSVFMSVSKNQIINVSKEYLEFKIPEILIPIGSHFSEKQ